MKHKNILLLAIMVLVLTCAGCGQQAQKEHSDAVPSTQTENTTSSKQDQNDNSSAVPPTQAENSIPDEPRKEEELPSVGTDENPTDGDKLFEISNLSGTVTEFSENGCRLSPTIESGDNLSYQAAPGYEDTFVSVIYNSDCTFQIAHIDFQTAAATYEPATVKDVKKQTSLIICGEYDENDVLHASHVFIYRIEGM